MTDEKEVEKKDKESEEVKEESKTPEELKAEADKLEAEYKALREEREKHEQLENQSLRIERIKRKIERIKTTESEVDAEDKEDLKTRDLITLGKYDIAEDSEKAKILNKYKRGGIIKSFAEGLTHPGVQAEFNAFDAKSKAKSVINENDSDDVKLKTEQEVINNYKISGEVPDDPKLRKKIAEANLKSMGL